MKDYEYDEAVLQAADAFVLAFESDGNESMSAAWPQYLALQKATQERNEFLISQTGGSAGDELAEPPAGDQRPVRGVSRGEGS